ncbi:MAG: alanine racemase, partial [Acidobacteria bacterium]|nr:alanine racemase [Acidobacteriota bacterium]
MIPLSLDRLAAIVGGELRLPGLGAAAGGLPAGGEAAAAIAVEAVAVDSRRLPRRSLFVALRGRQADGHDFLDQAAAGGAAAALVRVESRPAGLPVIAVASPLAALQRLAAWYRRAHLGRVLAITGSNGKTIVKDALYAQLVGTFTTAASPGSFNSQLGVPLAVLGAPPGTAVAVFEAGISAPGEMAALREILAPDCGILTNVGLAHIAAFEGRRHLAREKLSLFAGMAARARGRLPRAGEAAPADSSTHVESGEPAEPGWLLLPDGDAMVAEEAARLGCRLVRFPGDASLPQLVSRRALAGFDIAGGGSGGAGAGTGAPGFSERLEVRFPSGSRRELRVRTRSAEIVEDVLLAVGAACLLGVPEEHIAERLRDYAPPPTRLEVWRSPSGVILLNDLVSADPISVRAALRTASELAASGGRKVFVFGGMRELGGRAAAEYAAVGALAGEHRFDALLLVGGGGAGTGDDGRQGDSGGDSGSGSGGDGSGGGHGGGAGSGGDLQATRDAFLAAHPGGEAAVLPDVEAVRRRLRGLLRPGDVLLLKGPRHSGIAAAARDLMEAMAPNRLIVDLGAVAGNIAAYRRVCGQATRILAMVKALAYGSDLVRLSSWLPEAGVDHLGVSTADEGV